MAGLGPGGGGGAVGDCVVCGGDQGLRGKPHFDGLERGCGLIFLLFMKVMHVN